MTIKDPERRQFFTQSSVVKGFTHQEDIANGATGTEIRIPPLTSQRGITLQLICGASTGKVQYTLSPDEVVKTGSANWVDWEKGTVSGTEVDVITSGVTFVRGVSVSGDLTFELCI